MKSTGLLGSVVGLSILTGGATSAPGDLAVAQAQLYDLTTETGMPHLEENLRYTIQHAKHCLTRQTLSTAFPILEHPALHGCSLQAELREETSLIYNLVCEDNHGTRGLAKWSFERSEIHGVLSVTLGGKNMTFWQKVSAVPLGPCSGGSALR